MSVSIPNYKPTKEVRNRPRRVWNPDITKALKDCKQAWWEWRRGGEPSDRGHQLVLQVKWTKRQLRKAQRQAEAKRTIERVECIKSSDGSDREFYKPVKEQRKTADSSLQFLAMEGKIIESPDDICEGWATHFGLLATPLENQNFDNDVKKAYSEDINHILNICNESKQEINPVTVEEVRRAL